MTEESKHIIGWRGIGSFVWQTLPYTLPTGFYKIEENENEVVLRRCDDDRK